MAETPEDPGGPPGRTALARWQLSCNNIRQLISLTAQCRQVNCLVEMTPSAPSWRPPHRRGEFDGFPGQRERPNQCRHKTIISGLFNIAKPQKKSQKKGGTI